MKSFVVTVSYLSAIGALIYLANATRPEIAFSINFLARYNYFPTRRHWNRVKHILRYLKGTSDMGLFYANNGSTNLVGYADAGYLSDPHKARSQTKPFTCGGTAISWRSTKQSIIATYSNHAEIIAIHCHTPTSVRRDWHPAPYGNRANQLITCILLVSNGKNTTKG
ncbi:secreted RxLR effector protein 161-like [Lycium ferocissimum]|uniref:secreted RxLR effector protein 161-like n=1 Tax=Lycium ferocissimum TaxID=112874 RepID=UPI002814B14E|nr:secreted RxLR effector protein 161-like [Lycium ferocissimum]